MFSVIFNYSYQLPSQRWSLTKTRRTGGGGEDTWRWSHERVLAAADTTWLQIKATAPNRVPWKGLVDSIYDTQA